MTVPIDYRALDRLMPMAAVLSGEGRILHAGPTLTKLCGSRSPRGTAWRDVFALHQPDGDDLAPATRLHLSLRRDGTRLRGVLMPMAPGGPSVLNLAFGISEVAGIGARGLSRADFAPTDMTLDLLYLDEAKSLAMAETRRLIGRLQSARVAAEEQAFTDTLTGLKNRRALTHVVSRLIAQRRPFALTIGDLDHFKEVNDSLGHAAGDHVLQQVATALVSEVRMVDTVARIGGDEFVLVFDNLDDPGGLHRIAARIIERIQRPIHFEGRTCRVSGSFGTTMSSFYEAPDLETMMRDADAALYSAKVGGRGRHGIVPAGRREAG